MLIYIILLLISFIMIILANIFTRVDNTTISYEELPDKFRMPRNSKWLKLYFVYPKSLVTKSSFMLYISQIILFLVVLSLFIIQCVINVFTEQNEKLICIICAIYVIISYIISFGFDRIVQLYYKNKK